MTIAAATILYAIMAILAGFHSADFLHYASKGRMLYP